MARSYQIVTIAFLSTVGLVAPAFAQSTDASGKSAEELQQMFENQKTRGLVIAPSSSGNAATAAQEDNTATVTAAAATEYTSAGEGSEINVRVSFDFDSALLRDDQKPRLTTLCEAIANMEGEVFRIVGHTDASGSESYNKKLSLLRAEEVKRYMVGSCGIAEDRLIAIGVGEEHPVNTGDPRADENRRVEFQLIS